MAKAKVRAFVSPTCVLLALDWAEGKDRQDFLGFAIRRTPGFQGQAQSWLPNRIGFEGPATGDKDFSSDKSPIQKFLWWDGRIDDADRGKQFTYEAIPVAGTKDDPQLLSSSAASETLRIPLPVEKKIGTYFNRAVVSSQAFAKQFGGDLSEDPAKEKEALKWLANGLETVIPDFLAGANPIEGAIYHLTDVHWVIPAMAAAGDRVSLVYNKTKKDKDWEVTEEELGGKIELLPRTRAAIMHNKFLVKLKGGQPAWVLMGSANFTTGGLTTQANLLHTFDSPELAQLYLERKRLLQDNPSMGETAKEAGWSKQVSVGDAKVRVFFSPEPKDERESIDTIREAVRKAKSSVIFCLFMPTDRELREACFEAGDAGKMMFGLVNTIRERAPSDDDAANAAEEAKIAIYHRSRKKRDLFAHSMYAGSERPEGFWWEKANLPGKRSQWPVYIHHKFVVIDAETDKPSIYSGSANMSKNALYRNDENLLEMKGSPRLAAIYLTEFLRLYEHYRARSAWKRHAEGKYKTYHLAEDSRWARKHYTKGTPEYKARGKMAEG